MEDKTLELLDLTYKFRAGELTEVQYNYRLHGLQATKLEAENLYLSAKSQLVKAVGLLVGCLITTVGLLIWFFVS